MKILKIVGDVNDADYLSQETNLDNIPDFDKFLPLINEIKNKNGKWGEYYFDVVMKDDGSTTIECYDEDGNDVTESEISDKCISKIYPSISKEILADFYEFLPYDTQNGNNVHTIKSIEILEILNIEKLL